VVLHAVNARRLPYGFDIDHPLEDYRGEDCHHQQDGNDLDQRKPVLVSRVLNHSEAIHFHLHNSKIIPKIPFFLNKSVFPSIRSGMAGRCCPEAGKRGYNHFPGLIIAASSISRMETDRSSPAIAGYRQPLGPDGSRSFSALTPAKRIETGGTTIL